jgi:EamA domain-containing membrane protein RarD
MTRLFIILSIVFAVFGIAFTILPMGTIALIPIALALVFAFIAILRQREKLFPKILFLLIFVNLLTVIGKEVFVKDVVEADQQFESVKEQSEQEAQKELEDFENLQ